MICRALIRVSVKKRGGGATDLPAACVESSSLAMETTMRKPNLPMAALLIAFVTVGASAAAPPKPVRADANGDGALSKSEFVAQRVKRTMRLDGDGDGKVSLAEWSSRPMGAAAGGRDPAKAFVRLDTNKDGALDEAELSRVAEAAYSRLDADGDGKLTAAEQKAQLVQRRAALGK
jgi:hypothetical protein